MINEKTPPPEGLAPCPFCGENPILVNDGGPFLVGCSGCRAASGRAPYEAKAAKFWNRRASLATPGTPAACYCLGFDYPPIDPATGHRPPCRFQPKVAPAPRGETQTAAAPAPDLRYCLCGHEEERHVHSHPGAQYCSADSCNCKEFRPAALPVSPRPDLEERLARIIAPWFNLEGAWKRFLGNAREIIEALPSVVAPVSPRTPAPDLRDLIARAHFLLWNAGANEDGIDADDCFAWMTAAEAVCPGLPKYGSEARPMEEGKGVVPSEAGSDFDRLPWKEIIGFIGVLRRVEPGEIRFSWKGRNFLAANNGGELNLFEIVKAYPESLPFGGLRYAGPTKAEDIAESIHNALEKGNGEPSEAEGRCAPGEPVPMVLHCPECRTRHLDVGEFATKPHHTHACQGCGMVWRPAIGPTVGVQFLPGFKNEPEAERSEAPEAKPEGSNPNPPLSSPCGETGLYAACKLPAGHDGDHKGGGERWAHPTPSKDLEARFGLLADFINGASAKVRGDEGPQLTEGNCENARVHLRKIREALAPRPSPPVKGAPDPAPAKPAEKWLIVACGFPVCESMGQCQGPDGHPGTTASAEGAPAKKEGEAP